MMKVWSITGLLALTVMLLSGCGGGNQVASPKTSPTVTGPTTSATMTIVWPARGRLIPVAANYIRITLSNDHGYNNYYSIGRPPQGGISRLYLNSLPVGTLTVTATAHPDYYGDEPAQAAATVTTTAKADEPLELTVVMQSTITSVLVAPESTYIAVGATRTLAATAQNADYYAVMVRPTGAFTWTSSNTNIATVDQNGVVTGVAEGGPVTITATEKESGVSGTMLVTVSNSVVTANDLVGAWGGFDSANNAGVVVAFLDPSHYFMIQEMPPDGIGGFMGIESGTFTVSPTGILSVNPLFDTNGDWGFSNPSQGIPYTFSRSGDTIVMSHPIEGSHTAPAITTVDGNAIVGAWYAPTGPTTYVLLVFLPDGTFLLGQDGYGDEWGHPGFERGTYTWNKTTGAFSVNVITDTNGEWGLSHPSPGETFTVHVSGSTLTFSGSSGGSYDFPRVGTTAPAPPATRSGKRYLFR